MASSSSESLIFFFFCCFICVLPFVLYLGEAQTPPPLVPGLSWNFYQESCPEVEDIIRERLREVFINDIGQAPALLRIHFHDCFVRGCDGSLLLDGLGVLQPSEKDAQPNLTLRPEAFDTINDLHSRLQTACGLVVSCTDITALAARDSVFLTGGPDYPVPLGRRDGLTIASQLEVLTNLPAPFFPAINLIAALALKNLDHTDLVALSGAHTIGIGHCPSFENRLYPFLDPTLNQTYGSYLRTVCPLFNQANSTDLDPITPDLFDNRYFINLMNRQGLFTSDQDLYTFPITQPIVTSFAQNQTLFFEKFVLAITKMNQIGVLTGTEGEVRANCWARNSDGSVLETVVDLDGVVK